MNFDGPKFSILWLFELWIHYNLMYPSWYNYKNVFKLKSKSLEHRKTRLYDELDVKYSTQQFDPTWLFFIYELVVK